MKCTCGGSLLPRKSGGYACIECMTVFHLEKEQTSDRLDGLMFFLALIAAALSDKKEDKK